MHTRSPETHAFEDIGKCLFYDTTSSIALLSLSGANEKKSIGHISKLGMPFAKSKR